MDFMARATIKSAAQATQAWPRQEKKGEKEEKEVDAEETSGIRQKCESQ